MDFEYSEKQAFGHKYSDLQALKSIADSMFNGYLRTDFSLNQSKHL